MVAAKPALWNRQQQHCQCQQTGTINPRLLDYIHVNLAVAVSLATGR